MMLGYGDGDGGNDDDNGDSDNYEEPAGPAAATAEAAGSMTWIGRRSR